MSQPSINPRLDDPEIGFPVIVPSMQMPAAINVRGRRPDTVFGLGTASITLSGRFFFESNLKTLFPDINYTGFDSWSELRAAIVASLESLTPEAVALVNDELDELDDEDEDDEGV